MTLRAIHSISEIDLDTHGVIEASAGTGKTYTIEQLVISLLKNNKVASLDEILVVTFTDKAAGELKDRIRKIMVNTLEKNKSDILRVSLDNFDTASIYTIHGFCNKILQDYAFENQEQFGFELVDDREVYKNVLHHIKREVWPQRFGQYLYTLLKLSNYPESTADGRSKWENRVIDLVERYQPAADDRIVPSPDSDIIGTLRGIESEWNNHLEKLNSCVGPIDEQKIENCDLYIRYSGLRIRKQSIPKRLRVITDILRMLVSYKLKISSLICVSDFLSKVEIGEKGFDELNEGWTKDGPDYNEKLPRLLEIIDSLKKLQANNIPGLQHYLAVDTVIMMKKLSSEYKTSEGFISYEDMITHVYHALIEAGGTIKKVLQNKYKYALVDEFQDTDILQWKIFKILFLDSNRNRLFIIGDPKQAIYSFRGADLNAYYLARNEMIHNYSGQNYYLNENWRSSPGLIKSFNDIFADRQWFTDGNIQYLPNNFPRTKETTAHDGSNSIVVLDCGTCSGSEARLKTAQYIVREISDIIASSIPAVSLNEIAILIKKWSEAQAIEQQLKKANIKYSYYKKEGLYQSKEAIELFYILSTIANPSDMQSRKKALASRFFDLPINKLHFIEYLDSSHPITRLFKRWINYSEQKEWAPLFQSLLEDTGIRYRFNLDDYDRMMLNYQTIIQQISIEAYSCNFGIDEILFYLKTLCNQETSSYNSLNLHTIDMEKPGVQIMTIHASKGLEFKVVFIAGGYTSRDVSSFWTYHSGNTRIFNLIQDKDSEQQYHTEISGEEDRLYYVAFTRARDRLYIPIFNPTKQARSTAGIIGNKIPQVLQTIRNEHTIKWVNCDVNEIQITDNQPEQAESDFTEKSSEPDFYDLSLNLQNQKIQIASFSLLKSLQYYPEHLQFRNNSHEEDSIIHDKDETLYTSILQNKYITRAALQGLPASSITGLILHEILEKADFSQVKKAISPADLIQPDSQINNLIHSSICKHMNFSIKDDILQLKQDASNMLWNTLHASLDESNLFLCDIENKFHEVEFYYPSELIREMNIPGVLYSNGFIHGFIDMIFYYEEKYFIVDWKSNFLEDGYSPDSIKKNIYDMHYDLQILLYTAAVKKWLSSQISDYSPEQHFGGVYYLYLRGINKENPGMGIYFYS